MPEFIIYARKSTESEDRQVLSIPAQVDELQRVAERRGLGRVRIVEESMSAKAPGRPAFSALLREIEEGHVIGVLCWKLDRLARNPVDGGQLIWALNQRQLREIITPGRVYTGASDDKFMMGIEFGVAHKYIDDLSENVRRGIRARVQRGWCPSKPPPGYLADRTDPERRIVVTDPIRFPLIRRAFDLVGQGIRPHAVLDLLNGSWGYRTPRTRKRGEQPLSQSSFYALLRNPFYAGLIPFQGEVYRGQHDAMLSADDFERVQAVLNHGGSPKPVRHAWALTGLIRCACGGMVTASFSTGRRGKRYPYYHCARRKVRHCHEPSVAAADLEDQAAHWIASISLPLPLAQVLLEHLGELGSERLQVAAATRERRLAAKRTLESQLENLTHLRLCDLLGDDEYVRRREPLTLQIAELESSLRSIDEDPLRPARTIIQVLSEAENRFLASGPDEKRAFLSTVGSNPRLIGGKLHIDTQKPFSVIGERLKISGNWTNRDHVQTKTVRDLVENLAKCDLSTVMATNNTAKGALAVAVRDAIITPETYDEDLRSDHSTVCQ